MAVNASEVVGAFMILVFSPPGVDVVVAIVILSVRDSGFLHSL